MAEVRAEGGAGSGEQRDPNRGEPRRAGGSLPHLLPVELLPLLLEAPVFSAIVDFHRKPVSQD